MTIPGGAAVASADPRLKRQTASALSLWSGWKGVSNVKVVSQAATHPGKVRPHNEDRYYASDQYGLYSVADGVGGSAAGEVASQSFVDAVAAAAERYGELVAGSRSEGEPQRKPFLDFVDQMFQQACQVIFETAQSEPQRRTMATTGVVVGLLDGFAMVGHVGDSRVYLIRDTEARQLTTDHTFAQKLLDQGILTPDRLARTSSTKTCSSEVWGTGPRCQVDTLWLDVRPGDRLLLCSDGLSRYVDAKGMVALSKAGAEAAIDAANKAGGRDNITCVVIEVGEVGEVKRQPAVDTEWRMRALSELFLFRELTYQELLQTTKVVREQYCEAGRAPW